MKMSLPDPPTSSWLHRWWDSWRNPEECLRPQFSGSGCQNTERHQQRSKVLYNEAAQSFFTWSYTHKPASCSQFPSIQHLFPVKVRCIPEFAESLLVSLKHMPHVEVQSVGCVPVLQLLEVGVLCESHDVLMGGLAVTPLCSTSLAEWDRAGLRERFLKGAQSRYTTRPSSKRHTISNATPLQGYSACWQGSNTAVCSDHQTVQRVL